MKNHFFLLSVAGGLADGWYYASVNETVELWGNLQDCDVSSGPIELKVPWNDLNLKCFNFEKCLTPVSNIFCCHFGRGGVIKLI